MASYHCSIKAPLSRAKGNNLIGKAAYNARTQYRDERTGELTPDYASRGGLVKSFVAVDAKANAPEWFKTDPQRLLNAAVLAEKRKDAREGQEIVFGFIHELGRHKNEWMLNDFLREQFTRRDIGRVAVANIHAPSEHGDQRNDHAHVILLLRKAGPDGLGERLPALEPEDYERIRHKWAEKGAKELHKEAQRSRAAGDAAQAAQLELQADRYAEGWRPLEQQRQAARERGDLAHAETLNREATKHRGPAADAIERKGQTTERGNIYRDTEQSNANLSELKIELAAIQKAMADYERDWADRLEQAAIEKEQIERRFVEPAAPAATPQDQQQGKELTGTAAAIRQATKESDGARAFQAALAEKGIRLAITTKEEAEQSRADAAAAKEKEHYAPTYREGEIVAINERGHVYRLNERTTGTDFQTMQRYLRTLDRSEWQGIEATAEAIGDERRQRQCFDDAADNLTREFSPALPDHLKGTAADIWTAYNSRHAWERHDPESFRHALEEQRLALARATQEEAEQSQRQADFAREIGNRAPRYDEGEIVVINERGHVYRLNENTTGHDAPEVQEFLSKADWQDLDGIEATRRMMRTRAEREEAADFAERSPDGGGMREQQDFINLYNERAQDHMAALSRERDDDDRRRNEREQDRYAEQDRQSDYLDQQRHERELFEPPPETTEERRQLPDIKAPRAPSTERGRER